MWCVCESLSVYVNDFVCQYEYALSLLFKSSFPHSLSPPLTHRKV